MPRRSDTSDLTCCLDASPVLDRDNVYFSDQGWAYRHFKNDAKSEYWDEILVSGQALLDNGTPDTTADTFGAASPTFLVGDSTQAPDSGHQPGDGGAAVLSLEFFVTSPGSGYSDASDVTTTASTGTGTGLVLDSIFTSAGQVIGYAFSTEDGGDGYEVGDIISIDGGDGLATVTVATVDE